jgi:hypothetical protein
MLLLLLIISCSAAIPIVTDYKRHPDANIVTQSKKEVRQAAIDSVQKLETYGYQMTGDSMFMLKKVEHAWLRSLLVRFLHWVVAFLSEANS